MEHGKTDATEQTRSLTFNGTGDLIVAVQRLVTEMGNTCACSAAEWSYTSGPLYIFTGRTGIWHRLKRVHTNYHRCLLTLSARSAESAVLGKGVHESAGLATSHQHQTE